MYIIVYSSTDKCIDFQCTWKEEAAVAYFKVLRGIRGWELNKTAESFRYYNRCPGRNRMKVHLQIQVTSSEEKAAAKFNFYINIIIIIIIIIMFMKV